MKTPPKYTWLAFLLHLQLLFLVNADIDPFGYTHDGCYSGLDGFTSMGQSASMSSFYCMNLCNKKGYSVAAITSPGVCYCGNSIPATQVDSSQCTFPCPAYPQEMCGGSNGVYNVFHEGDDVTTAVAGASSATSNADTQSSTATATSSSSPDTTSPASTASPSPTASSDTTGGPSKTTSPTNAQASSNSAGGTSSTGESSAAGKTATATVTDSVTQTAASSSATSTSGASANASENKKSGGGLSGGAIAGIVVGVVCGLGAVAAIVAFILLRRRRDDFYSPQSSPTKFNDSAGFHGGYNANYPMVDQRLNPDLLGGDHRISIASLVDARDYSRQILKVVNPDDEKY